MPLFRISAPSLTHKYQKTLITRSDALTKYGRSAFRSPYNRSLWYQNNARVADSWQTVANVSLTLLMKQLHATECNQIITLAQIKLTVGVSSAHLCQIPQMVKTLYSIVFKKLNPCDNVFTGPQTRKNVMGCQICKNPMWSASNGGSHLRTPKTALRSWPLEVAPLNARSATSSARLLWCVCVCVCVSACVCVCVHKSQ